MQLVRLDGIDTRYELGRNVSGIVVHREARAAATDGSGASGVALAGHVAPSVADSAVRLESRAAVAFSAVFETGERHVFGETEGLARVDGHAVRGIGGEGQGARVGLVGAAEILPV